VGEINGVPGVAAFRGQGGKGDGVGAEGDDVIGADHALVAKAEAAGEIEARGQGAEVALRLASGDGEALIVVGAEAGEDLVGGVEIASLGEAEFAGANNGLGPRFNSMFLLVLPVPLLHSVLQHLLAPGG
jgi:hypothetical protein